MKKLQLLAILLLVSASIHAQYFESPWSNPGTNETPYADLKLNHFEQKNILETNDGFSIYFGISNNLSSNRSFSYDSPNARVDANNFAIKQGFNPELNLNFKSNSHFLRFAVENKKLLTSGGNTKYYIYNNYLVIAYSEFLLSNKKMKFEYSYLLTENFSLIAGLHLNKFFLESDFIDSGSKVSVESGWFDAPQFLLGLEMRFFDDLNFFLDYTHIKKNIEINSKNTVTINKEQAEIVTLTELNYHYNVNTGFSYKFLQNYKLYVGSSAYYQPSPEFINYTYYRNENRERYPQLDLWFGGDAKFIEWMRLKASYYKSFGKFWSGSQVLEYIDVYTYKIGSEFYYNQFSLDWNYQASYSEIGIRDEFSSIYKTSHLSFGIGYQF